MSLLRNLLLATALGTLSATAASAQGHGGQQGGSNGMGMGNNFRGPVTGTRPLPSGDEHGGLQLGPPGRWWDNKEIAKNLGLNSLQQRHMDDLFTANRELLLKSYTTLQHEESQLEKLTRSRELDENQIFQQIDRVTAARGDLEKATAHMQLQLRKELTADQTAKLDELRPPTGQ